MDEERADLRSSAKRDSAEVSAAILQGYEVLKESSFQM